MSKSPYHEAGRLLDEIITGGKSLRSVLYSSASASASASASKCASAHGSGGKGSSKSTMGNTLQCTKSTYATVCNALKHKHIIDAALDRDGGTLRSKIRYDDARSKGLLYVVVAELLFGRYGAIRGGGEIKRRVMRCASDLRLAIEKEKEKKGDCAQMQDTTSTTTALVVPPTFPRYVRVNTLKMGVEEAASILGKDVLLLDDNDDGGDGDGDGENGSSVRATRRIYADRHVPDLLVLPPYCSSDLASHGLVQDGMVILQDKSSCFPALALVHGRRRRVRAAAVKDGGGENYFGTVVGTDGDNDDNHDCSDDQAFDCIDACAAPGNKTTHLAALMGHEMALGKGSNDHRGRGGSDRRRCRIFAYDRSKDRIKILRKRLSVLVPSLDDSTTMSTSLKMAESTPAVAATMVEVCPIHKDFLRVDPSDPLLANVRRILLDPSCSGSGIANALDRIASGVVGRINGGKLRAKGGGHTKINNDATTATATTTSSIMTEEERRRVESLANFQLVMLKHAMSFPQVDTIVYSTCSIHDEENEHVVAKALREHNRNISNGDNDDDDDDNDIDDDNDGNHNRSQWKITPPHCLRHWKRRGRSAPGLLTEEQSRCMVRCDGIGGHDETNGFFVCYLERCGLSSSRRRGYAGEDENKDDGGGGGGGDTDDDDEHGAGATTKWASSLPIYNGEFKHVAFGGGKGAAVVAGRTTESVGSVRSETTTAANKNTTRNAGEELEAVVDGGQRRKKGSATATATATATTKSKNTTAKTSRAPGCERRDVVDGGKGVPKKKAKKMVWKRRQMEHKLKRLKSKKS